MKTNKIFVLAAAVTMLCMFFTGCTESDELTEIKNQQEQQEQQDDSPPKPLSDEFSKALAEVEGISDINVTDNDDRRLYTFFYNQYIDHHNKALGTYKQKVRITISEQGLTAPVTLYTYGYNMDEDSYVPEVANLLNATTMWVEHRYFGESLPEPFENLDFTYLNADQAAQDLHAIVSLMKQTVLKQSGQWVSTGISKDGITTGLQAYYSDIYGWDDIDLYMPFCAPFLEGTPQSCDDPKMGQYLYNESGKNYAADSQEGVAYQRLRQIPTALLQNKALCDDCMRLFHKKRPKDYMDVISTFGRSEENATAGLIYVYFDNLFDKFSYVPFKKWAGMVPDISDTEHLAEFVFMKESELYDSINAIKQKGHGNADARHTMTPKSLNDNEILNWIKEDESVPYYVQAARELGNIRLDLSSLDGMHFYGSTQDFGYLAATISKQFEISTLMKRYASQWDGGQLMKNFRQWVKTQNKYKMIFCYSANDPWTGGAIDESTNPLVKRLICKNGTHNDYFLNTNYYSKEESQELKGYISSFLGQ